MRITTAKLRQIIREEVKKASLVAEVSTNDTHMRVKDTDNGKAYDVLVQEGVTPYSVSISFESAFSINLSVEDAQDLCVAINRASVKI